VAAIKYSETSARRCCEILRLNERRYYRWLNPKEPEPRIPWNKIRPEEESAILEAARGEELCDLRAAGLMVHGHETMEYTVSVSTVQKTLKKHELAVPYKITKRRASKKPEIRDLITGPNKVYCYDGTEFYLTSGLRVIAVPILDIGSRKNLKNGVYVRSFTEQDVKKLWDETLFEQGIDTSGLVILSDRGGQMKGKMIMAHLTGKWQVTLVYARPHTPDDNPWIETFNRSLQLHPSKPDEFETVQDVIDWVELHKTLHNNHPHSSLSYVRPNDEHAGLGDGIRQQRKENLKVARNARLTYYYESKIVVKFKTEEPELVCNSSASL
jgi:hypothetical protein